MVLFPDRLLAIVVTALLTWALDLEHHGLEVVGSLGPSSGSLMPAIRWPFQSLSAVRSTCSSAVLIAMLGFFESSVTARSIRPEREKETLKTTTPDANSELIALGAANLAGGFFSTLPAFGGFGRSKLSVQAGATTPMSSLLLSIVSLLCVVFVLPWLYYVPKATLSALVAVVGISMMEECPHDIAFFLKARGYSELALMAIMFALIIGHSTSLGIMAGGALVLVELIRQATKAQFEVRGGSSLESRECVDARCRSSDDQQDRSFIVRIHGQLTFANCGDLAVKLSEAEFRWSDDAPLTPHSTFEDATCLIFDLRDLKVVDACGLQVLFEIVHDHVSRGTKILICQPRVHQVLDRLRQSGIISKGSGLVLGGG